MTRTRTKNSCCCRWKVTAMMLLDRSVFLVGGALVSFFSIINNNYKNVVNNDINNLPIVDNDETFRRKILSIPPKTTTFHVPPPPHDSITVMENGSYNNNDNNETIKIDQSLVLYYKDNDSIFGNILRGEEPASILTESTNLLMFQDNKPRAPLHGLIIPKYHIDSVLLLTKNDLPILHEMKNMANEIVNKYIISSSTPSSSITTTQQQEEVVKRNCNSRMVFHIPPFISVKHLHLHVLAPIDDMDWFYKDFKYTYTETRWCTKLDTVIHRLEQGKTPVPYNILQYMYRGQQQQRSFPLN